MEAYYLLHVDEDHCLRELSANWAPSMGVGDSSLLGPATTNGVANATTSIDLTRCMMAATDRHTLISNQGSSRRQTIDRKAPRGVVVNE